MSDKCLVVLSGGQDSTTCAALAVKAFGPKRVVAITFNYGQRHALELQAARDVAFLLGIEQHEVLDIGPILQGTSPLTNPKETLELYEDFQSMDKIIGDRVEKTFVPMRNALFLTLAANRAACMGVDTIMTGVCQADNANYPDCRAVFVHAQEDAINEALGYDDGDPRRISIWTPLMNLSKAHSIREMFAADGYPLLAFTHTAYDGQYPPVSKDHANTLRAQGFLEAGMPDPLVVRAWLEGLMSLPDASNYALAEHSELVDRINALKGRLAERGAA